MWSLVVIFHEHSIQCLRFHNIHKMDKLHEFSMGIKLSSGAPLRSNFLLILPHSILCSAHFHYFLCPFVLRYDGFSVMNCINMPTSFSLALATFSFHWPTSEWILIILFYFFQVVFVLHSSFILFFIVPFNMAIGFIFVLFAHFFPTQISRLFIQGTLIVCQSSFIRSLLHFRFSALFDVATPCTSLSLAISITWFIHFCLYSFCQYNLQMNFQIFVWHFLLLLLLFCFQQKCKY